ncbi:MAG: winged helix-turn-helix domain-containing protein [Planctomycetota bacterium]|nr:winged helix-turn-helix domain-containing protein [Planctomycetota bacterium]
MGPNLEADIGYMAGKIWRYLDAKGETRIRDLPKALVAEREMVCMGIGWLAREAKLDFGKQGGHDTVRLRR